MPVVRTDGRSFVWSRDNKIFWDGLISGMGRWGSAHARAKRAGGAPLLKWDLKTPVFFEKEDLIFLIIVAYR